MTAITPFRPEYAPAIARLHCQCISAGFLSALGEKFLARLYTAIAQDEQSVVLVSLHDSSSASSLVPRPSTLPLLGFISATLDTSAMYRRILRRHWLAFGLALLPRMVSPGRIAKVFETLRYGRKEQKPSTSTTERAELLSIAVDPSARGKGIGRELVAAFEQHLTGALTRPSSLVPRDCFYKVVTSAADPVSNAFYQRCGFTLAGQFQHHGVLMNRYVKSLA
jgi:GNAT superfamily N-acetyltransferase